jgi:hypothetical protein
MAQPASSNTGSCGCCTDDPKSVDDVVRELVTRRDILDRRLSELVAR